MTNHDANPIRQEQEGIGTLPHAEGLAMAEKAAGTEEL
jgi:hypothetical protein